MGSGLQEIVWPKYLSDWSNPLAKCSKPIVIKGTQQQKSDSIIMLTFRCKAIFLVLFCVLRRPRPEDLLTKMTIPYDAEIRRKHTKLKRRIANENIWNISYSTTKPFCIIIVIRLQYIRLIYEIIKLCERVSN